MVAPKPITLTSIPTGDYHGAVDPQPFVAVGGIPVSTAGLLALPGAANGAVLTIVAGALTWVVPTP